MCACHGRVVCRSNVPGLQSVPHIAAPTRGRGASRGGAAAAAWEAATVEIAAQRAREEADRFRLPAGLLARVNSRELDGPIDDGGPSSARKRKRLEDGTCAPCRCACRTTAAVLM